MQSYTSLVQAVRSQTAESASVKRFPAVLRAFILVSFFVLALPLIIVLLMLQLVMASVLFVAFHVFKKRQPHPVKTSWGQSEKVINPL